MKPLYYWGIIAILAIVAIIHISRSNSPVASTAQPASPTTSNIPAAPATATNPAANPVVKSPAPSSSTVGTTLKVKAVLLPDYYAQQIASTTLGVHVSSPASNTISASPIAISGEARGSWFFEGSFPVILTNLDGGVIAQGHVTANSNWMTTDFVPFSATLAFPRQKSGSKGYLVLKNDNPSGLAKNDAAVEMLVTF